MTDEPETETISGYIIDLPDDRSVWVARHPKKDMWCICLRTGERELKFGLSPEAANALRELLQPDFRTKTYKWILDIGEMIAKVTAESKKDATDAPK